MTAPNGSGFAKATMRHCGLLMLATALCLPASAGDSMRCGDRIVATGAMPAEVLGACGPPAYRDPWVFQHPVHHGAVADVEEWYYNFGPNQLLRILRFRHGRLAEIGADGYGYAEPPARRCEPGAIVEGLSKFRLLLLCGAPATREALSLLRPLRDRRTGAIVPGYEEPVYGERWVYDFGSRYLLRLVTLEDGRVVDVDSGARGSDAR